MASKPIQKRLSPLLFLSLGSYAPLFLIIGNVTPPLFVKAHHIALGLLFLISFYYFASVPSKKWIIYVFLLFLGLQFFKTKFDIKHLIDFFFGPFCLATVLSILINENFSIRTLSKHRNIFLICASIPLIIAILQSLGLFPLTFWNAQYINFTQVDNEHIPRPNGLLYHGNELSVLICFFATLLLFHRKKKTVLFYVILIITAYLTYYKVIVGTVTLLLFYYLTFVNTGILNQFYLMKRYKIPSYIALSILFSLTIGFILISKNLTTIGFFFQPDTLTGRGAIWNVYFDSIKTFSFTDYIFGAGIGSWEILFIEFATPTNWSRLGSNDHLTRPIHPHNGLLSLFLHSGIIGISFIIFLYKMAYTEITTWSKTVRLRNSLFGGVFVLPCFTIGITITIYDMAIYWICLSFLLIEWKIQSLKS